MVEDLTPTSFNTGIYAEAPGEFDKLLKAIRAGATYANVHTVGRPGGKIRGELK